jgi:hypothetical protein
VIASLIWSRCYRRILSSREMSSASGRGIFCAASIWRSMSVWRRTSALICLDFMGHSSCLHSEEGDADRFGQFQACTGSPGAVRHHSSYPSGSLLPEGPGPHTEEMVGCPAACNLPELRPSVSSSELNVMDAAMTGVGIASGSSLGSIHKLLPSGAA